jgi:probable phosphoglycerate mutase
MANKAMDEETDSIWFAEGGAERPTLREPQASVAEFSADRPSSVRAPERVTEPLTTLYLVRHGRTALTESKRISGGDGDNPPLSELGRKDAVAISNFIKSIGHNGPYAHLPKVDAVVASPILRASQTAQTIADAVGLRVNHFAEFIEIHFGEWDGLTNEEAEALDPVRYQEWRGSWKVSPPGGESLETFDARVQIGLNRLLKEHAGQAVVLVAHTMPVRGILRKVVDGGDAAYWRPQIAPCSLSIVRFWGPDASELVVANSTAHLP